MNDSFVKRSFDPALATSSCAIVEARSGKQGNELRAQLLPTFLGIGSMRCGSTWLYEILQQHPDIQMSRPKQLQFFNKQMLVKELSWYSMHFPGPGHPAHRPVRGEITPFYARLSTQSVCNIHQLLPLARIVLTIRHPVERVWSHLLLDWGVFKRRALNRMAAWKMECFCERARTTRYTDYERIIRRWRSVFGDSAVHVELYDRIKSDPVGVVRHILAHIGADSAWSPPPDAASRRVLASGTLLRDPVQMPDSVRCHLALQWLLPTRMLNDMLNGQVDHWVEDMESAARAATRSARTRRWLVKHILSQPEKCAYFIYDSVQEVRLHRRWQLVLNQLSDESIGSDASVKGSDDTMLRGVEGAASA